TEASSPRHGPSSALWNEGRIESFDVVLVGPHARLGGDPMNLGSVLGGGPQTQSWSPAGPIGEGSCDASTVDPSAPWNPLVRVDFGSQGVFRRSQHRGTNRFRPLS